MSVKSGESVIPALVESIVAYAAYNRSLNPQELFLAFAGVSLATAWHSLLCAFPHSWRYPPPETLLE